MRDIDCRSLLRLQENFSTRSKLRVQLPWQPLAKTIITFRAESVLHLEGLLDLVHITFRTKSIILTLEGLRGGGVST